MTQIAMCVVYEMGGEERKLFKYTLVSSNPQDLKQQVEHMGYKATIVPFQLAKGYCLWSRLLWKLSKMEVGLKRDHTLRRAMQIEKWLIVKFNKLVSQRIF